MSAAALVALATRVGDTAAARILGLSRSTVYGIRTGYGRRGRPRKSTELPTRGRAARPMVSARLAAPITLVVMYARAIQIREEQESGELVADPDPRVVDFVYGDAFDVERDQPFVGMYFAQEPPASFEDVSTHLDDYFEIKQQALEQATERPGRPFIKRKGVLVENLGSPEGAVIVGYLWRFYHEKGDLERSPVHETAWQRPNAWQRAAQREIMGEARVRLAYETYEELRPRREPR